MSEVTRSEQELVRFHRPFMTNQSNPSAADGTPNGGICYIYGVLYPGDVSAVRSPRESASIPSIPLLPVPASVLASCTTLVCEMETGKIRLFTSGCRLDCRDDPSKKAKDVPSSFARLPGRTTGMSCGTAATLKPRRETYAA